MSRKKVTTKRNDKKSRQSVSRGRMDEVKE